MYDSDFWKKVEHDRLHGLTVTEVCKKYHILPATLRRARLKGLLNDQQQLNAKEAEQQRQRVRDMGSQQVLDIYISYDRSLSRTLEHLNLSNSKRNQDCVKSEIEKAGGTVRSINKVGETKYTKSEFEKACSTATNLKELSHNLGLTVHTSNNKLLKRLIQEYDIDVSHWGTNVGKRKYEYADIFCENSQLARTSLRQKILQFNVMDLTKCSQCGISEWNGVPLKIQVDHINGNCRDNRLDNLRGLCPNCHSLTDTFAGNKRRK